MKKKLGEFTLYEVDEICKRNENCDTCPFHVGGWKQCIVVCEMKDEDLEKEFEVEE